MNDEKATHYSSRTLDITRFMYAATQAAQTGLVAEAEDYRMEALRAAQDLEKILSKRIVFDTHMGNPTRWLEILLLRVRNIQHNIADIKLDIQHAIVSRVQMNRMMSEQIAFA